MNFQPGDKVVVARHQGLQNSSGMVERMVYGQTLTIVREDTSRGYPLMVCRGDGCVWTLHPDALDKTVVVIPLVRRVEDDFVIAVQGASVRLTHTQAAVLRATLGELLGPK